MENSTITSQIIAEASCFISANVTAPFYAIFEASFTDNEPNGGVFAQTRPFVITNCIFTGNSIDDSSTLIYSTNPQVAIYQTFFLQTATQSSGGTVLGLGNYIYFIQSVPIINGVILI